MTEGVEVIRELEVETVNFFWPIFVAAFTGSAAAIALTVLILLLVGVL